MKTARSSFAAVAFDEKIYVLGGHGGAQFHAFLPLASAEVLGTMGALGPGTATWKELPPMHCPRAFFQAYEIKHKLYAFGGIYNNCGASSETAEVFDHNLGTWSKLSKMHYKRSHFATCHMDGKLYVLGGLDICFDEVSVESFDPIARTWKLSEPMPSVRRNGAVAAIDNKIYNIGGYNKEKININAIDVFDQATGMWTKQPSGAVQRESFGVAVVAVSWPCGSSQ